MGKTLHDRMHPNKPKFRNGKENGNYDIMMGYIFGLYRDNGKEMGNYYFGLTNYGRVCDRLTQGS